VGRRLGETPRGYFWEARANGRSSRSLGVAHHQAARSRDDATAIHRGVSGLRRSAITQDKARAVPRCTRRVAGIGACPQGCDSGCAAGNSASIASAVSAHPGLDEVARANTLRGFSRALLSLLRRS
jgi:hypothetical protein